jgi:hypothetical protein
MNDSVVLLQKKVFEEKFTIFENFLSIIFSFISTFSFKHDFNFLSVRAVSAGRLPANRRLTMPTS